MTARTKAFFQGSYFQDGQPSASIVPGRIRDLVDSIWSMAPVSVMDYGAVGDNNTDDSGAIQAAINAVAGNGNGCGFVRFPAAPGGAYLIKNPITLKMGVTLIGETSPGWGDGFSQTSFTQNSGSPCRINAGPGVPGAMIVLDNSNSNMLGMGIMNLVIDGRNTAGGGSFPGNALITYNGTTFAERRLFMWNCELVRSVGGGIQVNGLDGAIEISHTHFNICGTYGFQLTNGAGDVILDNCLFRGCGPRGAGGALEGLGAAVQINEGSTINILGGRIEENYGFGVMALTTNNVSGVQGSRSLITVTGTVFEHNDLAALCASGQGQPNSIACVKASGCLMFGNGFNASAYSGLTADDWCEVRANGYGRVVVGDCIEKALGEGVPKHWANASNGAKIWSNMNAFTDAITTPNFTSGTPAGTVTANGDINGI
ncbi:MAG TPA: glycosyl hydrolase family 28-related protein [Stellaceae bacterium]|nr:glycosyl hydrolase family 28-related protein [Stellaceae bacterium]